MWILLTTKWDTVPEHTGDSWRSCYPASHLHTSGPRYWEKTETITQGHMATFKISSLPYPNQCKCGRQDFDENFDHLKNFYNLYFVCT